MAELSPLAGNKAIKGSLIPKIEIKARYERITGKNAGMVKQGTSGQRGLVGEATGFSEAQVASMIQACCDIKKERGSFGPDMPEGLANKLKGTPANIIGIAHDERFVSEFAEKTAAEVFAGNGYNCFVMKGGKAVPTPVLSRWIIRENLQFAHNVEGVIVTASHNAPEEGGLKTNGRDGGPNTRTKEIDEKANYYLHNSDEIKYADYSEAKKRGLIKDIDFFMPYVKELDKVIDFAAIRKAGSIFGVAPLGGSACGLYELINKVHKTHIRIYFSKPDPMGSCRRHDYDGKLRGDPSSPYVMKDVLELRKRHYLLAVLANDNDADRFGGADSNGIITADQAGPVLLMHLLDTRPALAGKKVGRSIGTTHMLDAIAADKGLELVETNVGFKNFVSGLLNREYMLAIEESGGASFPTMNGDIWTTEKDGIAVNLLMWEAMAIHKQSIHAIYAELVKKYGAFLKDRIEFPATVELKSRLASLAANREEVERLLKGKTFAGREIDWAKCRIGDGIKIVLEGGSWALFRASGTEDIIKTYVEDHRPDLKKTKKGDKPEIAMEAAEELKKELSIA
jgi:phosphoglucomutase